jgi:lysyl-tRNA synthetase, class II
MALTDQEIVRREKLQKLIAKGIDPFGQKFITTHHSADAKKLAEGKTHDELEAAAIPTAIAGRLVLLRNMGKASFVTIQDKVGSIQAYIRKDVIGDESYSIFELADLGDIVGVEGTLMLTKTGEITVKVSTYTHLVKSLRPLPEKYHGLSDIEERYRRRYVDLIVNEDARKVALMRPRIIRLIQQHMDQQGFVEFETSMLQSTLGGASARPLPRIIMRWIVTSTYALPRNFL